MHTTVLGLGGMSTHECICMCVQRHGYTHVHMCGHQQTTSMSLIRLPILS